MTPVNCSSDEYKSLPSQLEWSINDQAIRSDPLLHYYHTSQKTPTPQGYVQWGRIRERDINMDKPFERGLGCHDFDNFIVLYGNSEAYEAKYFFDLSTQMRATQAKMSVFAPPGSNGDYYIGFVWVHDWETFQHIFAPLDDLFITLEPPPEIKPQSEKADGEKNPRDTAPGWSARVTEDNALFQDAPLTIMLRRPREGSPLSEMKMPAATSVDEDMPTINVYLKTFPSAVTVKARLKALDKHRFRNNKTAPFDEKRRLLVGRDLSVTSHVDLLEGIPEAQVEEMIAKLNSSQRECILTHCRNVRNGVNLIHGPFGSGKTVLVALLCKLQSVRVPGSQTFVACSSNSACDAVVPKFTNSNLMVVRAHALSLERKTLLKDYHAKQRSGELRKADPLPDDYVPPVRPQKVQPALEVEGAEMIQGGVDGNEEDTNHPDDNATHPGYDLGNEAENFDQELQGGEAEAEKFTKNRREERQTGLTS
ncbi:MAG: hypothetical protein ALECFALPRED_002760 [Alectoria fallacina]|uniref:DNA2/NAM7 helicase helicase domain-containing protein n=1 Tax=Alectoria fallacina TaxID=1903189 RepID=A0A8H3FIS2_9LECA|nr:MAG: hypothetical protein ALECFALPRED_002760 [Alectoria fallacina]